VAIYFLGVKSFGRSAGSGGSLSTSAAAYRSGERIRDERTGRVYDHSQRRDIEHKEILLPSGNGEAPAAPDWARERSQLWNMVERSEPRVNSRVAREYIVALPHELNAERRTALARTFAQEISNRYHNVVDLAVHQPRSDPRNFHAHLLTTTREIGPSGLGPKTIAELTGSQRFELGLPRAMQEHAQIRERWAVLANEALREAGLEVRISHIPDSEAIRQPGARPWLPRVAWEIERRGGSSILGDRVREQFAQSREVAPVAGMAQTGAANNASKSAEEVRNQAILEWRSIRGELGRAAPQPDAERQIGILRRELGRDDLGF
jgi:hypothetical protein